MEVRFMQLDYEEFLSGDSWALRAERQFTALLQVRQVVDAGPNSAPPDKLAVAVEVKHPGGTWQEVASTAPTSEEGTVKVLVPMPTEALKHGEIPPVFRLRVKHWGRRPIRWNVSVDGLW